jgi:hypothetical protein
LGRQNDSQREGRRNYEARHTLIVLSVGGIIMLCNGARR